MQLNHSAAAIRRVIDRLDARTYSAERTLLEAECRTLEDAQAEWEASQREPDWLPFVWDCVLFLTQGMIYTGFLIRSVVRPTAAITDAVKWALEGRRRIEEYFIKETDEHQRLRGGVSHGFRHHTKLKKREVE